MRGEGARWELARRETGGDFQRGARYGQEAKTPPSENQILLVSKWSVLQKACPC